MATFLTVDDLTAFTAIDAVKAQTMIDDAEAWAVLVAPCIASDGFANQAAVKAVLRGAVLRWNEGGFGALQSESAGPFSKVYAARQDRRGLFTPSEIVQLQSLCASGSSFTVSLAGPDPVTVV